MSEKLSNQELNQWLHENLFRKCWHELFFKNSSNYYNCRKCKDFPAYDSSVNYCENIADAWRVIDQLRSSGWLAVVKDMPDGFPNICGDEPNAPTILKRACAEFLWMPRNNIEDTRKYIRSHTFSIADTPSRAICEAARKAVEADFEYKVI